MTWNKRLVLAAALAGTTALTSLSASAFFSPFNLTRGWGGNPWGWDGYGWNPYYGGWGHPYYGAWSYPYYGGWGYPYYGYRAWGYPYSGYPAFVPTMPAAPVSSSDK